MEEFWKIVLDSLIDTAKLLPILLIVYFLIEFLEYKNALRFENSKLLNGKISPVMGSLFGTVPQCGVSVISAELYSEHKISIGALVAVFVATSDEAIPIMLSDYKSILPLLILIATKIVMAILVGYLAMYLYKLFFKKHFKEVKSDLSDDEHEHHEHEHVHACCNHDIENQKFNWKHPLIHCLKIAVYIFLINIVFGTIILLVGEDNLVSFLQTSRAFQPLFAVLVGLIPNCVSSVVLTELYLMGGLSFGAIVAGLSVNAGIGLIVLLKENKIPKENLFIVLSIVVPSLVIGYLLHIIPFNLI